MTESTTNPRKMFKLPPRSSRSRKQYDEWVNVTPAMAASVLEECNTHNRAIRQNAIDAYARDMKSGKWYESPHGLIFSTEGVLLDGQNRLWAVIEAGIPVRLKVTFQCPMRVQSVIDNGDKRSLADCLTLAGGYGTVTRHHVGTLNSMLRGFGGHNYRRTIAEQGALYKKHKKAIEFALEVMLTSGRIPGIVTAGNRAIIARAWYSCDHDGLRRFGHILKTGESASNGDAVVTRLRDYLIGNKASRAGNGGSEPLAKQYAKVERTLQAYLQGENLKHVRAASQELFPLPEEVQT